MPSPVDNLLDALKAKKYDVAIALITEDPKLVNTINPVTGYSIMKTSITGGRPLDLIKFLVSQPDFNFTYLNVTADNVEEDETNIDVILKFGRKDVLEFLLNDPQIMPKIILNNQQLTYESAVKKLEAVRATFNKEHSKSATSIFTERAKARVDNLEKMIPMLAEATIKYAVAKDDPILCIRLEKAGVDLDKPLSSEKKPVQLLNRSNPKLLEWFMGERFANKAAKRAVVDPDCLNKQREAQSQLDAARQGFFAEGARILGKATAGRLERMKEADKISPPSRKL
ncbi:hypothetical protein [Legionella drancourtii]|uniref:Ankyrin repeat-containing protein n=1 Tax=Legionella drancourtii LLAP12 TaxID=658187 RepID=G9ELW7_9GAMM|nr:hypothetical protein [Legionella drancourtii]EHL31567.1 hypothetical protein LDG_6227 [Legionella drancourtii LLAP12]